MYHLCDDNDVSLYYLLYNICVLEFKNKMPYWLGKEMGKNKYNFNNRNT